MTSWSSDRRLDRGWSAYNVLRPLGSDSPAMWNLRTISCPQIPSRPQSAQNAQNLGKPRVLGLCDSGI